MQGALWHVFASSEIRLRKRERPARRLGSIEISLQPPLTWLNRPSPMIAKVTTLVTLHSSGCSLWYFQWYLPVHSATRRDRSTSRSPIGKLDRPAPPTLMYLRLPSPCGIIPPWPLPVTRLPSGRAIKASVKKGRALGIPNYGHCTAWAVKFSGVSFRNAASVVTADQKSCIPIL